MIAGRTGTSAFATWRGTPRGQEPPARCWPTLADDPGERTVSEGCVSPYIAPVGPSPASSLTRQSSVMTSPIETSASAAAKRTSSGSNRRNNLVLRALIDEMLERVRELNRSGGVWTGDERARAEAELDAIMARVRRVAAQRHAN